MRARVASGSRGPARRSRSSARADRPCTSSRPTPGRDRRATSRGRPAGARYALSIPASGALGRPRPVVPEGLALEARRPHGRELGARARALAGQPREAQRRVHGRLQEDLLHRLAQVVPVREHLAARARVVRRRRVAGRTSSATRSSRRTPPAAARASSARRPPSRRCRSSPDRASARPTRSTDPAGSPSPRTRASCRPPSAGGTEAGPRRARERHARRRRHEEVAHGVHVEDGTRRHGIAVHVERRREQEQLREVDRVRRIERRLREVHQLAEVGRLPEVAEPLLRRDERRSHRVERLASTAGSRVDDVHVRPAVATAVNEVAATSQVFTARTKGVPAVTLHVAYESTASGAP